MYRKSTHHTSTYEGVEPHLKRLDYNLSQGQFQLRSCPQNVGNERQKLPTSKGFVHAASISCDSARGQGLPHEGRRYARLLRRSDRPFIQDRKSHHHHHISRKAAFFVSHPHLFVRCLVPLDLGKSRARVIAIACAKLLLHMDCCCCCCSSWVDSCCCCCVSLLLFVAVAFAVDVDTVVNGTVVDVALVSAVLNRKPTRPKNLHGK